LQDSYVKYGLEFSYEIYSLSGSGYADRLFVFVEGCERESNYSNTVVGECEMITIVIEVN